MLEPTSAAIEEIVAIWRGILGLVGTACDDLGFVRRIQAVARIADGEPPPIVAHSLHMNTSSALKAFHAARDGGLKAIVRIGETPRPAFDMALTLFVGRLTEAVFERRYRSRVESWGYRWTDMRSKRSEVDFSIDLEGRSILDINTKNASTQYRRAPDLGLDPSRIVPLGIYKLLAGRKSRELRKVPFVFAYLVDWGLSRKAQEAGNRTLNDDELRAASLLLNVDEDGRRKAEDAAVAAMFERSSHELIPLADTADDFEAIGLERAMVVFLEHFHERAPALRNTRAWAGQIGYFIKMGEEMTPWRTVMELLEKQQVQELARQIDAAEI